MKLSIFPSIQVQKSLFLLTNSEIFVGFTNPEELLQFVVRSEQEGKFVCTICQSFFHAKKYHVRNHVESKHFPNTFEYPCNICQKSYYTRKALESHLSKCKQVSMIHRMWINLELLQFHSNFILFNLIGSDPKQLNDYMAKYPDGGPKAHICKLCGKVCSDKSNIRKHVENIHFPGVFVHTCKHCNQTLKTRNLLYMHISKVHKNQDGYWSSLAFFFFDIYQNIFLGEDRRLFYEYIVKDASSGPKAHKCTLCGKVGNDRGNLRKHVENIHFPGSFSYDCKYCTESFTTRNNLNMHISKTHNKNVF